jgi:hypothetical protein
MRAHTMAVLVSASLLLGFASNLRAEELNLDFKLVNSTGYSIKELYIAPTSTTEWGTNILKKTLADGEVLEVTFNPEATAARWDLRIVWEDDGKAVFWTGYKLTDIEKITLKYNEETEKTTAKVE